MLHHSCMRN